MSDLNQFVYDRVKASTELANFRRLLTGRKELREKEDVLPFFKQHRQLTAAIATLYSYVSRPNRLRFEHRVAGHFRCDLLIGQQADDAVSRFILVEFEDARPHSIFGRGTSSRRHPEWGRRLEHGFSQIIDWFWWNDENGGGQEFRDTYGPGAVEFHGLLVTGRTADLDDAGRRRLHWRSSRLKVGSQELRILTYDDLHEALANELESAALIAKLQAGKPDA